MWLGTCLGFEDAAMSRILKLHLVEGTKVSDCLFHQDAWKTLWCVNAAVEEVTFSLSADWMFWMLHHWCRCCFFKHVWLTDVDKMAATGGRPLTGWWADKRHAVCFSQMSLSRMIIVGVTSGVTARADAGMNENEKLWMERRRSTCSSLFLLQVNAECGGIYVSLGSSLQDMSNSRFWLSITCSWRT